MRVERIQSPATFKQLHVRTNDLWNLKDLTIKQCEQKLKNTKFIDIVIDEHGIAIKKKMTETFERIQSFSLFTQENAVGINVRDKKSSTYKFKFPTLESAKTIWKDFYETSRNNSLEGYTKVALFLDEQFKRQAEQEALLMDDCNKKMLL